MPDALSGYTILSLNSAHPRLDSSAGEGRRVRSVYITAQQSAAAAHSHRPDIGGILQQQQVAE